MTPNMEKRVKAKLAGSLYFALLGAVNFGATIVYSELRLIDVIILSITLLPLLVKQRVFCLVFGILAGFIWYLPINLRN